MLRDPHHDLNLLAFRDFVASKPPNETFRYAHKEACACGQFAKHIGLFNEWWEADLWVGSGPWADLNHLAALGMVGEATHDFKHETRWSDLRERLDAKLMVE